MFLLYYYLIIAVILAGVLPLGLLLKKKSEKAYNLFLKIFSLVLGLVFIVRYMWGNDAIQNVNKLENSPFNSNAWTVVGLFLVWLTYAASLLCSMYGFFRQKLSTNFVKFIAFPISLINIVFLKQSMIAVLGESGASVFSGRGLVMAIEIGLTLAYAMLIVITSTKWKELFKKRQKPEKQKFNIYQKEDKFFQKVWSVIKFIGLKIGQFFKKYWFDIFAVIVIFISVMPPYMLQGLFGFVRQNYKCKDFEIPHRIILYIGLILPVIVHFTLKNKDYQTKKYLLLYICLGTLLSFSLLKKGPSFLNARNWPLHLCNTAMYIMPIVLIFNMKRFFYFTYFINVIGALFAMFMPNYSSSANMFSTSLVHFYINHYIAFFMPLLFVSLGLFEKPRLKQFIYSMLGFAGYFLLVLVLNAYFTGVNPASPTDFFFINSDFVADKLGLWAENLRNVVAQVNVGGITMTFYPLYQSLFFIVYVAIGLAMWFVYEQAYQIADNFNDMRSRKEKIKLDKLALEIKLNGRSKTEPMNENETNKLILKDFTKRYGTSDVYAVYKANLEIKGGEIFGFLGPNGSGKSTIIKTIVGIQPITDGSISVCGYDVKTQPVMAKKQFGYVPDHYALYEKLTGREYINYIADLYDVSEKDRTERINDMLEKFELKSAFDNQMKTYSHGMKQKIAIMSALVHNPKIWILDEPLTGLDPTSIFQVKECMKEHAKKGNIVFFSSHIIDVVERICDRIAIIKKGHILTSGISVDEIEKSGITLEDFYLNTIKTEILPEPVKKSGDKE